MKTIILAAAILLSSPYPLNAGQRRDAPPTVSIPIGDLDLASATGQATLNARVTAATRQICRHLDIGSPLDWIAVKGCERKARAEARVKMLAATNAARQRSRLAQNGPVR